MKVIWGEIYLRKHQNGLLEVAPDALGVTATPVIDAQHFEPRR